MRRPHLSGSRYGFYLTFLFVFLLPTAALSETIKDNSPVYQYSVLDALLRGELNGAMTYGELSKKGDFGLGTFNGLDGEMVAVDGYFYCVDSHGNAAIVHDDVKTPFAVVTPFMPSQSFQLPENFEFSELANFLNQSLGNSSQVQAIRIDGKFKKLLVRSVPRQLAPFRPLVEILKTDEVRFEHSDVEGTLVGFRSPDFMKGVNVAGYHFHFIDKQRSFGGHVLELLTGSGQVNISYSSTLEVALPELPSANLQP